MINKQKRFSAMADGTDVVDEIIVDRSVGNDWFIGMDFDTAGNPGAKDLGTRKVPMSRVALLTDSGLIPASMLPGIVSTSVRGNMEYDSDTHQWTFTANDGTVYGCPKKIAGQTVPDESVVYVDDSGTESDDYYQYMFVPAIPSEASDENVGTFYCLPSPFMLVDGEGTHIHDDQANYARSVNIRTSPSDTLNTASSPSICVVDIDGKKYLSHVARLSSAASIGVNSDQTPGFGGSASFPFLQVDTAGHIIAESTKSIKMPNTPARIGTPGLVTLSDDMPSRIGTTASAGTTVPSSGSEYVAVARADHSHPASSFKITRGVTESQEYDGSKDVSVSLDDLMGFTLPSAQPTANAGSVLLYDGEKLSWAKTTEVATVQYLDIAGSEIDVSKSKYFTTLGTLTKVDRAGDTIDVGTSSVTGMLDGMAYMVTYCIRVWNTVAAEYYDSVSVGVAHGSLTGSTVELYSAADRTYMLDSSRTESQFINGSAVFTTASGLSDKSIALVLHSADGLTSATTTIAHGTWKAKLEHMQITELR